METVNSRPESMIFQTEDSGETNPNDASIKKSTMKDEISSLSSIDSINDKTISPNEKDSPLGNNLTPSVSSTTTDSDLESEQGDSIRSEEKKNDKKNRTRVPKRVKYFRKLFTSEIPDDMPELLDYYVCAYQGDILLQGKMFITDRYLCFYSRIINYVTKHVYRWEDICNITKERVAYIFPTAIGIKLKESKKKVLYASFLSRDDAYEKIASVWLRYTNNKKPLGDDEGGFTLNEAPKLINKNLIIKNAKHNSRDSINGSESEEVTEVCLDENDNNSDNGYRRRVKSVSPKLGDEKQRPTTLVNTHRDKLVEKNPILNQKLPNRLDANSPNTNKPSRFSRRSKKEQKQNDITQRSSSLITRRTQNIPLEVQPTPVINQPVSLPEQTSSEPNSSSALIPNINPPVPQQDDSGFPTKIFNKTISIINLIIQPILSLFHHFHMHPTKAATFILLFLTILFFHSFYLIVLAYRVENRLQSLHNLWPSSLMKNSL
ncbi:unnamed protein product [Rotaria sp. Silwood1]|nr:unnamed protein product [Rotaria sp. Silwood1]CAF3345028.1 unnamed protein product [Rotaria sp. Silwood1]CAF4585243.1 unnamed protein product [Rotaria sp. Silwood1]